MKIKYTNRQGILRVRCPNINDSIRVASHACTECKYFNNNDKKSMIVDCNYNSDVAIDEYRIYDSRGFKMYNTYDEAEANEEFDKLSKSHLFACYLYKTLRASEPKVIYHPETPDPWEDSSEMVTIRRCEAEIERLSNGSWSHENEIKIAYLRDEIRNANCSLMGGGS